MICFPNAKINIGLRVTERRPDGYHNIETIFCPVKLQDALEIVPSESSEDNCVLNLSGIKVDGKPENNLVIKALNILREHHNITTPLEIYLHKSIPSGAGLGGGSSDAAFMLKAVSEMYNLGLSNELLSKYASEIGADCPFFLSNTTMYAQGIGDIMEPVSIDLSNKYIVLIKPEINVSTAEAYGLVKPRKAEPSLKTLIKEPVESWRALISNDFEECIFQKYPVISQIKKHLYEKGAVYASMSGSGSAVYGLFIDHCNISEEFPDCFYWGGKIL